MIFFSFGAGLQGRIYMERDKRGNFRAGKNVMACVIFLFNSCLEECEVCTVAEEESATLKLTGGELLLFY